MVDGGLLWPGQQQSTIHHAECMMIPPGGAGMMIPPGRAGMMIPPGRAGMVVRPGGPGIVIRPGGAGMKAEVQGHCDQRFRRVAAVFARHFERGEEAGAAVCVYQGDELVVDLWAGQADPRAGRPWERDTPCLAFSCAKAVTATAALRLAAAGACDLDGPVAAWWPEFAASGKARATGVQLLSHQAGLPAFRDPVTVAEAADPAAMAARLAAQAPEWEPGTAHGYHALTYGWLAGELVRRLSGQTVGEYLAEHIAGPHGLDLWLGPPDEVIGRAARISRGPAGGRDRPATDDPPSATGTQTGTGTHSVTETRADNGARDSAEPRDPADPRDTADPRDQLLAAADSAEVRDLARRAFGNPDPTSVPGGSNSHAVLSAGWPASGLLATAAGLAGFYRLLLAGQIISPAALQSALTPRATGPDRVLGVTTAYGLGFMLPSAAFWVPAGARAGAFGHSGLSGATSLGDTARGLAIGYVTNRMGSGATAGTRAARLVSAVYASAG
jgi:CubicO group peptidase (beta-lactamase class C family)